MEEARAISQLEYEMLKDIKEIAPEKGTHRLNFIDVNRSKAPEESDYEKTKSLLSQ